MAASLRIVIAVVVVAAVARAQSFNVNVSNGTGPASSYGAAGLPGVWNNIPLVENVMYPLVGLDGSTSNVSMRNAGGTALVTTSNPAVTGNDALLFNSYRVTYNSTETCLRFFNLQSGVYQITTYAWIPNDPTHTSYVHCDESSTAAQYVGGTWPSGYVFGVNYAIHIASPQNAQINVHCGLSGGSATVAALNGIQLRLLTAYDGNVGLGSGGPFDILKVNGSNGGPNRTVTLGLGAPLTITMAAAPGGQSPAPFILFGTLGHPAATATYTLPLGIGQSLFPPCLLAPATPGLFTVVNGFGLDPCGTFFPPAQAPWSQGASGPGTPFTGTLQAVIQTGAGSYAVSNAITVVFQ